MAVNRERKKVKIGAEDIGSSYDEFTIEMLQQEFQDYWGHLDGDQRPISYVVYCEGDYDGGANMMMDAYRLETDVEMGKRVAEEEYGERRNEALRSKIVAQQLQKEADPEYQKYLELQKKFEGRL